MKKLLIVICVVWFLIPSMVSAGELRVYDDNNQYLQTNTGKFGNPVFCINQSETVLQATTSY